MKHSSEKAGNAPVFEGQITCPSCEQRLVIEVGRNPKALTEKQPSFLIKEAGNTQNPAGIGHLFINSKVLTSPVLYFGTLRSPRRKRRVKIYYNRALMDSADSHLVVRESIPSPAKTPE